LRGLLTALVFTCALAAHAQDLTQKVDYTTRAKPLTRVLADLSKSTHVYLDSTNDIENEPLILKLHGVTLEETMGKVADVFGGVWTKTDKGYRLSFGPVARSRHQAKLDKVLAELTASISNALAENKDLKPLDEDGAAALAKRLVGHDETLQPSRNEVADLSSKPILEMLTRIDPKELIYDGTHDSIEYSNEPTSLQNKLPDCDDLIAQLVETENLISTAVQKAVKTDDERKLYGSVYQTISAPVRTAVLRVDAYAGGPGGARLAFYDANGVRQMIFTANFGKTSYEFQTHRAAEQKIREKIRSGAALGPVAEDIVPHILAYADNSLRPVSQSTRDILTSPLVNEPLSIATCDIAFGLAGDRNIVYLPTEYGESWAYISSRGSKVTYDLFQAILDRGHETEVTEDDGWLIGRPVDPIAASEERVPRESLDTFAKQISQLGATGIDAKSDLALATSPATNITLARYDAQTLCMGDPAMWNGAEDWALYALYGSLDSSQRRSASQDTLRLKSSDLSKEQWDLLQRWLLLQVNGLDHQGDNQNRGRNNEPHSLEEEPYVAVAGGLGADGYVEVTDRSELRFHPKSPDPMYDLAETIDGLARVVAFATKPDQWAPYAAMDFKSIQQSHLRTVSIHVVLADGCVARNMLTEDVPSGEPMSLDALLRSLPLEMQQQYAKSYAMYKAQVDKSDPSSPSSEPAKPPRF